MPQSVTIDNSGLVVMSLVWQVLLPPFVDSYLASSSMSVSLSHSDFTPSKDI